MMPGQQMQPLNQPLEAPLEEMNQTPTSNNALPAQAITPDQHLLSTQTEDMNKIMPSPASYWPDQAILTLDQDPLSTLPKVLNRLIPAPENVWPSQAVLTLDQNPQPEVMNQIVPAPENDWPPQVDQDPLSIQPEGINQIMPTTQTSRITHLLINTNQIPAVNQLDGPKQIAPAAESWVTNSMVNSDNLRPAQVTGVPWRIVALMYPSQPLFDQTKERNSTVTSSSEPIVNSVNAASEVHPHVPQVSDQLPAECEPNSPGQLVIDSEVQPDYEQDNPTIAIPLTTDPNVTPELLTFRPGIYEGDAIPPVYSAFSIIAAPSDYKHSLPSPVYPDLSIIPELICEEVPINEHTMHAERTNNQEQTMNSSTNVQPIAEEDVQMDTLSASGDTMEQKLPIVIPEPFTISAYKSVDAHLLTTLHKKLVLIYKDYHFIRESRLGLKIRWRCVKNWCKAYLYSVENKITIIYPIHNHLEIKNKNMASAQATESDEVFTLEDGAKAVAAYIASFNESTNEHDNIDMDETNSNTLNTAEIDTTTLSYSTNTPLDSVKTLGASQSTSSLSDSSLKCYGSNAVHVVTAANTIISHDPSLEITVKSKSTSTETVNNDVVTSVTTTLINGPDPLAVCATTYTPSEKTVSASIDYHSFGTTTNFNYMTVPNDVKAKVTITPIPPIFKPQVYYDGKPAHTVNTNFGKNSNISESFVPTNYVDMTNAVSASKAPSNTSASNRLIFTTVRAPSTNDPTSTTLASFIRKC